MIVDIPMKKTDESWLTTREVSKFAGVQVPTLLKWVREGLLHPKHTGNGTQRRIQWANEDAIAAKEIADKGGRAGVSELVEELAPTGMISHLTRARAMRESLPDGHVIVVGDRGPRQFRDDTSLRTVMRTVSKPRGIMLVIP
jgi:hypothetical protein